MTPKRAELIVETTFATIFVTALVLGAALPGPWVLRVMLVCGGIYGLSCAFYSIFERLGPTGGSFEPDGGGPGGGPDGGERVPTSVHLEPDHDGVVRGSRVLKFPRAA